MKMLQFYDYEIKVDKGVIFCDNPILLKLLNEILAGAFGKFNNGEVYPDKDSAIANYLSLKLKGD